MSEDEFFFFNEKKWEIVVDYLTKVATDSCGESKTILRENLSDALAGYGKNFFKCPNCKGLLIPKENDEGFDYFKKIE